MKLEKKVMSEFYPKYIEGKLDPQSISILQNIADSNGPSLSSLTPQQVRESFFEKSWLGECLSNVEIISLYVEYTGCKIPIRVYTPDGQAPFPILVFYHGGGFVAGKIEEFDAFCSYLASGASCVVVSVDYRLAPEHKFPAAVEDAFAALNWVTKNAEKINGDPSRIAVAGDSAGGNLTAVTTLLARDNGFPELIYQVLICPWVDLSSTETDSYKNFGEGLWLSTKNIYWYRNHYLNNPEEALSPLVSPILSENLSNLPPALVITSEFDVLKDEGEAYAKCLKEVNIPVKYCSYKGMVHDFVVLPGLFDRAKDAIDEICRALTKVYCD